MAETPSQNENLVLPTFTDYQENIVSDGNLKEGDSKLIIFPMVSACIPLVIKDSSGNIVAAIHMDTTWNLNRLQKKIN